MMNICKAIIKIVKINRRKWLLRLNQNGIDLLVISFFCGYPQPICNPVDSSHLTSCTLLNGTRKSRIIPEQSGKLTAKKAYSSASGGCRKKQMLKCNVWDIGCNITSYESMPTSDRFLIAREFV